MTTNSMYFLSCTIVFFLCNGASETLEHDRAWVGVLSCSPESGQGVRCPAASGHTLAQAGVTGDLRGQCQAGISTSELARQRRATDGDRQSRV